MRGTLGEIAPEAQNNKYEFKYERRYQFGGKK
jgi:hypothetical protein